MERAELRERWDEMWQEGNWIPSWPDSLAGLTVAEALWKPDVPCHSIWEEIVHVLFWRTATLRLMTGGASPTEEEIRNEEFALPDRTDQAAWEATLVALKRSHDDIAVAILEEGKAVERIVQHLIHDGYHLGRITQLRAMQGSPPRF